MNKISVILVLVLGLLTLPACTFQLTTTRHEIAPAATNVSRVAVSIYDSNLGGGEQAYVNASIIAQLKAGAPGVVLAAAAEDLSMSVEVLEAKFVNGGWYTFLSLGIVKRYFQLGTVRVVNRKTGAILAVHDILLTGRRVSALSLEEYQQLVLPKLVELLAQEMKTNGVASNGKPLEVDVTEDLIAALP